MEESERLAELDLLIEEQRKDDAERVVRSDVHYTQVAISLDGAIESLGGGGSGLPVLRGDFVAGVSYDFEEMIEEGDYEMQGEVRSHFGTRPSRGRILVQIPHGTSNGYSNYGCRCERCVAAMSERMKGTRDRRLARPIPEHVHGTANGYTNYGCRRECCRAAVRVAKKSWKRKKMTRAQLDRRAAHNRRFRASRTPAQIERDRAADRERKRAARQVAA